MLGKKKEEVVREYLEKHPEAGLVEPTQSKSASTDVMIPGKDGTLQCLCRLAAPKRCYHTRNVPAAIKDYCMDCL